MSISWCEHFITFMRRVCRGRWYVFLGENSFKKFHLIIKMLIVEGHSAFIVGIACFVAAVRYWDNGSRWVIPSIKFSLRLTKLNSLRLKSAAATKHNSVNVKRSLNVSDFEQLSSTLHFSRGKQLLSHIHKKAKFAFIQRPSQKPPSPRHNCHVTRRMDESKGQKKWREENIEEGRHLRASKNYVECMSEETTNRYMNHI